LTEIRKSSSTKLQSLEQRVAKNPDSPSAHLKLGMAFVRQGALDKGEAEIRKALELAPDYAEAWVNLGGVKLTRFDFTGCVEANQKAVDLRPDFILAHYNKGLGLLYLGEAEKMVACYQRVIELDPEHPGGHYHLAVGLYDLKKVADARRHLNISMNLGYSAQPEFIRAMGKEKDSSCGENVLTLEIGPDEKDGSTK